MGAWWLNSAWMLHCCGERAHFARACRRAAQTQAELLRQTLHANRDTCYGRRHRFADIGSVRAFQDRVPATTYADYVSYVDRIGAGEQRVLTSERVELLEPTSGTSGGEKLIPCTAGLRRQFQRGVAAWIADLMYHRPALRSGRAYWSISPTFGPPRRTSGGLPIGFGDDAEYLGRFSQWLVRKLLVVPPAAVLTTSGIDDFRRGTLRHLLAAQDLTMISVWSPTFLIALVSLLDSSPNLPEKLRAAWPKLALISCWTDAASGLFVPELRRLFPHVEIQPKGLLATEAFVSFPLIDRPGAALALRSHFFEFEELPDGRCRLTHELDRGGHYRVIVTTAGGLYRYQLRDEIEVVGFLHQCPLVRFCGKSDQVSDLVGEKLSEEHVRTLLERIFAPTEVRPRFVLLVPVLEKPPRYRLYFQGRPPIGDLPKFLASVRCRLEDGLSENPYYRHAVAHGQLAPVEVVLLDDGAPSAWLIYESRRVQLGQKCGDIKPAALDRWTGWPGCFEALALARCPQIGHRSGDVPPSPGPIP